MARLRKNKSPEKSEGMHNGNSSSSAGSAPNGDSVKNLNQNTYPVLSQWRAILGFTVLIIALCIGYMGYLETRVNTPFDDQKMVTSSGLDDPERYWGSYRPGVYFGMKTRDPHSLVMGLMWYYPKRLHPGGDGIRHWCEQGDDLERYGWLQHDGRLFGRQEIQDGDFLLDTSFVKTPEGGRYGGSWTARITVTSKSQQEISLIWYTALDETRPTSGGSSVVGTVGIGGGSGGSGPSGESELRPSTRTSSRITGLRGRTPGLGDFSLALQNHSGAILHESFLSTAAPGLQLLKETVAASLRSEAVVNSKNQQQKQNQHQQRTKYNIALGGELLYGANGKMEPNFVATQLTVKAPFTLDVIFESADRPNDMHGDRYTQQLRRLRAAFDERFERTYNLQEKGFTEYEQQFAKASLSNMLGGIGYFYGASRVQSEYTKEPVPYWKAPLYTAVPSRSFFPRGFLWDEGFHGLLISSWDLDIELDIMGHWFDLINVEGWIPREQILGIEALSKVPEEFVTQRNTNANPPTFFLTLQQILRQHADSLTEEAGRLGQLERLYPRLQAWFNWFNTTQRGELAGSYRWRGRDATSRRELNPKTLTSGLDDYPRASHPDRFERHLDLRCWLTLASEVLTDLAQLLGRNSMKYQDTYQYLSDERILNDLHLSPYTQTYSDFGLHTDSVRLARPEKNTRGVHESQEMQRLVTKNPEYRYVDTSFGYVSLFPFLVNILQPDSMGLGKILQDVRKPELLWTDYGLRSLAKNSPLYMKHNTEHDPPYWRGPIWLNMNFLAVRALYFYGNIEGPYKDLAMGLYKELRVNLIRNVLGQYRQTGYVWEQYNDTNGKGKGCRPFNGWTALITLIMAEKY